MYHKTDVKWINIYYTTIAGIVKAMTMRHHG